MLAATATAWGGALLAGGLWIALHGRRWVDAPGEVLELVGLAAASGGLFVFMVLVADRWFPRANRRWVVVVEWATFVLFAAAAVGVGVRLAFPGGSPMDVSGGGGVPGGGIVTTGVP